MDLGLAGKRCVVTGASRGIGRATAELLAAEGARLLLVGRDRDGLAEAAPGGAEVEILAADVTRPGAAELIVAACVERLGGIDVLVNNAGTLYLKPLDELEEADWETQWQLNVRAPERLMRAAVPLMAEQGWGRIVNVSSTSAKRPSLRNASYTVTKAAELALSRTYAEAYAAEGVLVNAVAPGLTASELWVGRGGLADQTVLAGGGDDRRAVLEAAAAKLPRGRFGKPEETAAVIAFLCSELAGNVVGAVWSVDGGAVQTIF